MTKLRTVDGPETFIHSNWLDLPAEGKYDLVLGHGSLNMLSWESMGRLIPQLSAHLCRGGRAILVIQASHPAHSLQTLEEAIAAYPGKRTGRPFLVVIHFLVESLRSVQHPEMTNREFYQAVVSRFLKPDELKQLMPLTREKRNFYPKMRDLQAVLRESFDIIHQEPLSGLNVWDTYHLFVLQPCYTHPHLP